MGKLATWAEVNAKAGSSGSPANRCPTKAEILATGKSVVSGTYAGNQLVQLEDVNPSRTDNRISIRTAIYNGSGLIQATSTYPVASTITISGEWQDDLTGRGTFSIAIPAGASAGSTEVYLSSSYVVNFYVDSAGASPSSDDTYSYTLYN